MNRKPKLRRDGSYPIPEESPSASVPPGFLLDGGLGAPYHLGARPWKGAIPRGSVCEIVKGDFDWRRCHKLVGRMCTTRGPKFDHPAIGPCYLCHVPALGGRAWIATSCLRVIVPIVDQSNTPPR
jgi:hypothetical protein